MILKETEEKKFLEEKIDDFVMGSENLIMIKEMSDHLEISDLNLKDLSFEKFTLQKENLLIKSYLKEEFLVFEFQK